MLQARACALRGRAADLLGIHGLREDGVSSADRF